MNGERPRSPEEMSEINKSRLLSDAEAVKGGADVDAEGKILFTEKQKMGVKELMEADEAEKERVRKDAEVEKHGSEWLAEYSDDAGASFEKLRQSVDEMVQTGVNLLHGAGHEWNEFPEERYDHEAMDKEVRSIIDRYEEGMDQFMKHTDLEKLRMDHPHVKSEDKYHLWSPLMENIIGFSRIDKFDRGGHNKKKDHYTSLERLKQFAEKYRKGPEQLAQDVVQNAEGEKETRRKKIEAEIKERQQELEWLKTRK